jgi:hypothetical protein
LRFAVSILGSEVLAFEFGASGDSSEPETMRYDPTSTTACQTETVFADQHVVVCESPFGFGAVS